MGNPSAPSPDLLRHRSTSTVLTRAQHPGPFYWAGGHDQMLARSWSARKAGICSRRTARHRGTPRESSARMRSASPQQGAAPAPARLRLESTPAHEDAPAVIALQHSSVSLSNAGKECGCSPSRSYGIISDVRKGVKTSGWELPTGVCLCAECSLCRLVCGYNRLHLVLDLQSQQSVWGWYFWH